MILLRDLIPDTYFAEWMTCTLSPSTTPLLLLGGAPQGAFVNHFPSTRRFRTHAHGRGGEALGRGHSAIICICVYQKRCVVCVYSVCASIHLPRGS